MMKKFNLHLRKEEVEVEALPEEPIRHEEVGVEVEEEGRLRRTVTMRMKKFRLPLWINLEEEEAHEVVELELHLPGHLYK